jgi:vacuolar-type H+-ATPase subunit H
VVDLKINAYGIDIIQTVETFDVLGKIAPIAEYASGKISLGLGYKSILQSNMQPALETIDADGSLKSQTIGIKGSGTFHKIGEELQTDALDNMTLKDVDLDFEVKDGTLHVKPFETKMKEATMNIEGQHKFNNDMDYNIDLSAPSSLLGLENPAINSLYRKAAAKGLTIDKPETVDIKIKVTGKLTDPKVQLDLKEMADAGLADIKEEIKEEVIEKAVEKIEEKKEEVVEDTKEKAREEADKIMKEAEKKADVVRKEAKKAADALRAEAKKNGDKAISSARNPIEKKAAQISAKKLNDEAEKKAQRMENEADTKATKILEEAQKKANATLK